MNPSVLKFGGTSVASPEKIQKAAQTVATFYKKNPHVIVVVSAMGHTTDDFISLAHSVSPNANRHSREMDMLLSAGERISMALLAMALSDLDIPTLSLTGSQSGIITTSVHRNAQITALKPFRIADAVANKRVVIVAGFQGVSETKEITTLGRGGSDTSAIALAIHFQSRDVHILSDVTGFFSADPRLVPRASYLPELTHRQAGALCHFGAQLMHSRSIDLAAKYGVSFRVAHHANPQEFGTWIHRGRNESNNKGSHMNTSTHSPSEHAQALALSLIKDVVELGARSKLKPDASPLLCIGSRLFFEKGILESASRFVAADAASGKAASPQRISILTVVGSSLLDPFIQDLLAQVFASTPFEVHGDSEVLRVLFSGSSDPEAILKKAHAVLIERTN